tara:strand:- start:519 stop:674 length:156 start_codon:yes stop_codon:yes gene_type:complete
MKISEESFLSFIEKYKSENLMSAIDLIIGFRFSILFTIELNKRPRVKIRIK